MDTRQKIGRDESECRSEEEKSSWNNGNQDHQKKRSQIQATTITIHLVMGPTTTKDKTQTERKREMLEERRDLVETREGVEGQQRNEKGGGKEKEQRSIGTQTTLSLERFVEGGSEAETTERSEANIQSLPPEILIRIISFVPDLDTRFGLRHLCSELRNLIDARVCWRKWSHILRIDIERGGWWFSLNGVWVGGSAECCRLFHSYKRLSDNVCAGIRAIFRRINIRKIVIFGADYLTDTHILLTLAQEMLTNESTTSDRQLQEVMLVSRGGRLKQPLLFSIFIPVAAALKHLNFFLRSKISKEAEDSAYRLIRCCTGLQGITLWPIFSLRCFEAVRGRPIGGLRLEGLANMGGTVETVCNSLAGTLMALHLIGDVIQTFLPSNLNNKKQLRAISMGNFRTELDTVDRIIRELAAFPNLYHILFIFARPITCESLVSMVATLLNAFGRQGRIRNQIARHIVFRLENDYNVDRTWPQASVIDALAELSDIFSGTRPVPYSYGWEARPPLKWLVLRRENVSISLYCNCISE